MTSIIKVKRDKDGKVFTSDMSTDECIIEINFCEAHTRVLVQERTEFGLENSEIFCHVVGAGSVPEVEDSDHGEILSVKSQTTWTILHLDSFWTPRQE